MSFYFIANNLHFALELVGALVFFVMGWLAFDAYVVNKNHSSLMRVFGFCLVGAWQVIHAFGFAGDLINFTGLLVYILGLLLLMSSFLTAPRLAAVSAVILIPSFAGTLPFFQVVIAILLGVVAFLAYRQAKREYNKALRFFWVGFIFLAIAALAQSIPLAQNSGNILWYVAHAFEVIGFVLLTMWIWQYLKLRVRESLVLISISMTLFIATIVTLAFSTILIGKIEKETRSNLLINAKVFDFSVQNLTQESGAEAKFISKDPLIASSLLESDLLSLQTILTQYLESEQLGFLLVTDKSGTVMMRAHSPGERGDSIVKERAVEEALIGNNFATIESSPGEKFSIRAGAPIYKDGKIIGAVITGFPLDNVMVDRIKKITGLDATLYQGNMAVASTALAVDGRSRLTNIALTDNSVKDAVLSQGKSATIRVTIKNAPFLASYLPITNGDDQIVGMFSAAKPQGDIIEIANSTNRLTLVTVTVLLLLLSLPIFSFTKRLLGEV